MLLVNTRHKNKQESDKSALEQYREVADRQQKQIERQDVHIQELSQFIDDLRSEHSDCHIAMASLYGEMVRLHDYARRVAECCKKLGQDPGDPPPLPDRPPRPDRDAEFRRRTLAQTTHNLQHLSDVSPPQQGGKP